MPLSDRFDSDEKRFGTGAPGLSPHGGCEREEEEDTVPHSAAPPFLLIAGPWDALAGKVSAADAVGGCLGVPALEAGTKVLAFSGHRPRAELSVEAS